MDKNTTLEELDQWLSDRRLGVYCIPKGHPNAPWEAALYRTGPKGWVGHGTNVTDALQRAVDAYETASIEPKVLQMPRGVRWP